ncbi:MAG TPA: hypothetical protein DGF30_13065 [Desulfomicrobium sp.]|nr:hypothetical protein [Desulfomicrobium sp.]
MGITRPGIKEPGFIITEDQEERIAAALDIIEAHMGLEARGPAYGICLRAMQDVQATPGENLSPMRKAFQAALVLSSELQSQLDALAADPTAEDALESIPGADARLSRTQAQLADLQALLMAVVQDALPHSRKFPEQVGPVRDVVTGLAELYERTTGRPAASGVRNDRINETVSGPFFESVDVILKAAGKYMSQESLRKEIERYLGEVEPAKT